MWRKKGVIVVLIIFLISVTWGIIYVYNDMPKSLIGNSKFKIYYSRKPLEIRVETAGYNVYLVDGKVFKDIKDGASAAFNKIIESVKSASSKDNNKLNDSEELKVDNSDNSDLENNNLENNNMESEQKDNDELKTQETDSNTNVNGGN